MFRVNPEKNPKTNFLQNIKVVIAVIKRNVEVQDLLDKDHEVVYVHLDDGGKVKLDDSAEQFEDTNHDDGGSRVEVLEEVRGKVEERNDDPIAQIAQLYLFDH